MDVGHFSGRRVLNFLPAILSQPRVEFPAAALGTVANTFYGGVDLNLYLSGITPGTFVFTVNSWAYNDVAGEGIITGQNTAAGSSAVPGLGGLAALAIGAAGVRSRRQPTVA